MRELYDRFPTLAGTLGFDPGSLASERMLEVIHQVSRPSFIDINTAGIRSVLEDAERASDAFARQSDASALLESARNTISEAVTERLAADAQLTRALAPNVLGDFSRLDEMAHALNGGNEMLAVARQTIEYEDPARRFAELAGPNFPDLALQHADEIARSLSSVSEMLAVARETIELNDPSKLFAELATPHIPDMALQRADEIARAIASFSDHFADCAFEVVERQNAALACALDQQHAIAAAVADYSASVLGVDPSVLSGFNLDASYLSDVSAQFKSISDALHSHLSSAWVERAISLLATEADDLDDASTAEKSLDIEADTDEASTANVPALAIDVATFCFEATQLLIRVAQVRGIDVGQGRTLEAIAGELAFRFPETAAPIGFAVHYFMAHKRVVEARPGTVVGGRTEELCVEDFDHVMEAAQYVIRLLRSIERFGIDGTN